MVNQIYYLLAGNDTDGIDKLKDIINSRRTDYFDKIGLLTGQSFFLPNEYTNNANKIRFFPTFLILQDRELNIITKGLIQKIQMGLFLLSNPSDPEMFLHLNSWIEWFWESKGMLPVVIILNDTQEGEIKNNLSLDDEMTSFCKSYEGLTSRFDFTISWYRLSELQSLDEMVQQMFRYYIQTYEE